MRRLALTAAVLACLAAPAAAGPPLPRAGETVTPERGVANATGASAEGLTCGMVTGADPTREAGWVNATVFGGPVTVDPPTLGLTVVCTIQRGTNDTHAESDLVPLPVSGTGAVVLPPTTVSFIATPTERLYLCTEWRFAGTAFYFDATTHLFTTNPGARCVQAGGTAVVVDPGLTELLDAVLCPIFALVFPPEGDIPGIWDCPPYD